MLLHILQDSLLRLIQTDGAPSAREAIHMQFTVTIKPGFMVILEARVLEIRCPSKKAHRMLPVLNQVISNPIASRQFCR